MEMTEVIKLEMPTLKEAIEEAGGHEKLLEEQSHKLRLWLNQQPHLPQNISEQRLKFFICSSKFNVEKVKKRLDLHYTIRNIYPEIANLDPLTDDMMKCYKYGQAAVMPKLTPNKCRLIMARIVNTQPLVYDASAVLKYGFMILDILAEEDIVTSEFIIMDMANYHFAYFLKHTPAMWKRINITLESYGTRIKAIHIINATEVIDLILSTLKTMLTAKIFQRIHSHKSGIESLYGILPKSILPADYGGDEPPMATIAAMWQAKFAARREWFLEQEKNACVNESLRTNSVINPDDLFGVPGTFQKLDID